MTDKCNLKADKGKNHSGNSKLEGRKEVCVNEDRTMSSYLQIQIKEEARFSSTEPLILALRRERWIPLS